MFTKTDMQQCLGGHHLLCFRVFQHNINIFSPSLSYIPHSFINTFYPLSISLCRKYVIQIWRAVPVISPGWVREVGSDECESEIYPPETRINSDNDWNFLETLIMCQRSSSAPDHLQIVNNQWGSPVTRYWFASFGGKRRIKLLAYKVVIRNHIIKC